MTHAAANRPQPPVMPGLLLGLGLGGFVDGIVLHQVLQWHHMLTGNRPLPGRHGRRPRGQHPRRRPVPRGDVGLVFVGMWIAIGPGSGAPGATVATHIGLLLVGWGAFNVVEGVVDHHLLHVHHVRDDVASPLPWDLGFLVLGVALVTIGLGLFSSGRRATAGDLVAARGVESSRHAADGV